MIAIPSTSTIEEDGIEVEANEEAQVEKVEKVEREVTGLRVASSLVNVSTRRGAFCS